MIRPSQKCMLQRRMEYAPRMISKRFFKHMQLAGVPILAVTPPMTAPQTVVYIILEGPLVLQSQVLGTPTNCACLST